MASIFSGKAGRAAAQAQYDSVKDGRDFALSELEGGMNKATGLYDTAYGSYQPYAEAGGQGLTTYLGSLGLGGAEGNAAAGAAFQAGPGFEFALDRAMQGGARAASAAGMGNSGNAMIALADRAQNMQNQEYGNWQDRLSGLSSLGLQATSAQAGNRETLGQLAYGYGSQRGQIRNNAEIMKGQATAGGIQAGQTAAANRFGAVMGGVNTLASLAGNFLGGPGGAAAGKAMFG